MQIRRLNAADQALARELFVTMAGVFGEDSDKLSDDYLARLLARDGFWAIAAIDGEQVVGGLTAHTLPMTATETSVVFLYDLAVRRGHQRRGVGRLLVQALREAAKAAGASEVFVGADNADEQALGFYRAMGGEAALATFFSFPLHKA
ncbi:MAG TPA: GNAT family N-acetyltransferase [Burkholderiaceae bacterium]